MPIFRTVYKYDFVVLRKGKKEQIGVTQSTHRRWILFLWVWSHNKPVAFTSNNYISEHLDCLFHSIHFDLKVSSLFLSHGTKRGLLKRCPSLLPLRNLKCFKHFTLWGETMAWLQGLRREQKFSVSDLLKQVQLRKRSVYIMAYSACPQSHRMTTFKYWWTSIDVCLPIKSYILQPSNCHITKTLEKLLFFITDHFETIKLITSQTSASAPR